MQHQPLVDRPAVDEIHPDPEHPLWDWLWYHPAGQALVLCGMLFVLVGVGTRLAGWYGGVLGAGLWATFVGWYASATITPECTQDARSGRRTGETVEGGH